LPGVTQSGGCSLVTGLPLNEAIAAELKTSSGLL